MKSHLFEYSNHMAGAGDGSNNNDDNNDSLNGHIPGKPK